VGIYSDLEEEKTILSAFVSSPYSDIIGVRDLLSDQIFAALVSRFSRNLKPFQQRLIEGIVKKDIPLPPHDSRIWPEISTVFDYSAGSSELTISRFAQSFRHHAMKELVTVKAVMEKIPTTTFVEIINEARLHPLSQSTRYLPFNESAKLSVWNPDVQHSPFAKQLIPLYQKSADNMSEMKQILLNHMRNSDINQAWLNEMKTKIGTAKATELFEKDTELSTIDHVRYLCSATLPISFGFATDARTMEDLLTKLYSAPMLDQNLTGMRLRVEMQKLYPVLFGHGANIKRNEFAINLRNKLADMLPKLFDFEANESYDKSPRLSVLPIDKIDDRLIAAALVWEQGRGAFMQYYEALTPDKTDKILGLVKDLRNVHDPLPRAFDISLPVIETMIDYGADRDLRRNRKWSWMTQWLSASNEAEMTPLIDSVPSAKQLYSDTLAEHNDVFQQISDYYKKKRNPGAWLPQGQLACLFGHKVRRLISGSAYEMAYVAENRSPRPGHLSYRDIAQRIGDYLGDVAPNTASSLYIDRREYPPELTNAARDWFDSR